MTIQQLNKKEDARAKRFKTLIKSAVIDGYLKGKRGQVKKDMKDAGEQLTKSGLKLGLEWLNG